MNETKKGFSPLAYADEILGKKERGKQAQHCQCRSGSPDTCPKCTDMETGEKYADQDVAD